MGKDMPREPITVAEHGTFPLIKAYCPECNKRLYAKTKRCPECNQALEWKYDRRKA